MGSPLPYQWSDLGNAHLAILPGIMVPQSGNIDLRESYIDLGVYASRHR